MQAANAAELDDLMVSLIMSAGCIAKLTPIPWDSSTKIQPDTIDHFDQSTRFCTHSALSAVIGLCCPPLSAAP